MYKIIDFYLLAQRGYPTHCAKQIRVKTLTYLLWTISSSIIKLITNYITDNLINLFT